MAGRPQNIFEHAVGLPAPAREEYLSGACGADEALRSEVAALLRIYDQSPRFLADPTAHVPASAAEAATIAGSLRESPGTRIGPYKLLQLIGEGGFGSVFMAEQEKPVSRRVALKIIKLGMDTRVVIARFEAERQALALMEHPNIARVLDAGATETGRPFFVMELVKGDPIVEYCDRNNLSIEDRLELFAQVCNAVQHAHTKGIIHRDIKPSNILVSTQDGRPNAKVIDFGIAKATASKLTEKTLFTEHRALIGTPEYMSPEQAEGSMDIDTRTDVYSLGVLLYELLTGTTPFSGEALRSAAYAEIQRIIREVEPPKPSTRISHNTDTIASVAARRHTEPKRLGAVVRGELDWIVMKALEKDRARRYETANGLAMDVRRYLAGEAVVAAPPSTVYRFKTFVRRNKGPVVAATLVMGALLAAFAGASWGLVEANRAQSIRLQQQIETERRAAADTARLGRNAEAVNALLDQCEEALRAGDAAKAGIALDAARKRSSEGGADKDAGRLSRLSADLDLLVELDEIDQFRWTWPDDSTTCAKFAMPRIREAIKKFGADPEVVSVESAAAAANASAVRERIVAALDWVLWAWKSSDEVSALLRRLDDDPFRNEFRDALRTNTEDFVPVAMRPAALEQRSGFAAFMGEFKSIDRARRIELLQAAALRRPRDVGLLMTLGRLCLGSDAHEELRWYQAAVAADPTNPGVYNNLGVGLKVIGRPLDAIACYHRAIELDPKRGTAYANLGNALEDMGQPEEGLANHLKAVELSPDNFENYCILGNSLGKRGRVEEGIRALMKSIELNPTHAESRYNLGLLLGQAGRWTEAMESLKKAIEINPNSSDAYGNMGVALRNQGRLAEAVDYFEKAIELNPRSARFQSSLGGVLGDLGRNDEAIAMCKKAIESDPKHAMAYYNLGSTYLAHDSSLLDDAIANLRKAVELDPKYAESHCNLAQAFDRQGKYEESLAEYKRGHELGGALPDWKYPSAEWVRRAQAKVGMAAKLPALLKGEYQPVDNAERLDLALICQNRKLNHAAFGLYAVGLAADPKVGDNVEDCVRYNAASVAALSAAGEGEDASKLSDDERVRLRKQALDWLRADFNVATTRLESSSAPVDAWSRWFCDHSLNKNPDLLSIRDPAALAKLSTDEQQAFTQLWADMAALLKKTEAPTPHAAQPGAPPVGKNEHP